jgi:hypothetical protein
MRTSIWYRTEEQQPDASGYYLTYRGWGIGGKADGDSDHGYVYYDKREDKWRQYQSDSSSAIVYYWTDATPDEWTDLDPPSVQLRQMKIQPNPALEIAWRKVEEAIRNYELIKTLSGEVSRHD